MSISLPTDLRRFNVGTLLVITTTFAISFALDRGEAVISHGFVTTCTTFWVSMAIMTWSDYLDNGSVDGRRGLSQFLNCVAILTMPPAFIAWFGMLFFWLCAFWTGMLEQIR